VPLFHHCYAGNKHHSTIFGALIQQIAKSCRAMARGVSDQPVFDKGNNSNDNLTEAADSGLHFVGSWMIPTRPGVSAAGRQKILSKYHLGRNVERLAQEFRERVAEERAATE
jgi:hypothetical protein